MNCRGPEKKKKKLNRYVQGLGTQPDIQITIVRRIWHFLVTDCGQKRSAWKLNVLLGLRGPQTNAYQDAQGCV